LFSESHYWEKSFCDSKDRVSDSVLNNDDGFPDPVLLAKVKALYSSDKKNQKKHICFFERHHNVARGQLQVLAA
jgi:hypothetical protein